jgi:hypothetical protein
MTKLIMTKQQKKSLQEATDNYAQVVLNNKDLFKAGAEFTEEEFCKMFNLPTNDTFKTYKDTHRNQLRKVREQSRLNLVLAVRGLYLKSLDYGSTFKVLSKTDVQWEVSRYSKVSHTARRDANILQEGINNHKSRWKKLTAKERVEIGARIKRRMM